MDESHTRVRTRSDSLLTHAVIIIYAVVPLMLL
jgi:hypothetical protein